MNPIPRIRYYLLPLTVFWLLCAYLIITMGYQGSFLFLNGHCVKVLDPLMLQLTHLAGGIVLAAVMSLVMLKNHPEKVILMIISLLICGLIIFICKQIIFYGWDRPSLVFEGRHPIHTVDSYILFKRTFPSGHSVTVASIFTLTACVYYRSKPVLLLFFFLTILLSYTRIYLGVHFLGDVWVASMIGTCISLCCFNTLDRPISRWFGRLSKGPQMAFKYLIFIVAAITIIHYIINLPIFHYGQLGS